MNAAATAPTTPNGLAVPGRADARRGPPEAAFAGLLRAYGLIARVMRPYFLQYGLNPSQWAILRNLERAEQEGHAEGLRPGELGQRLLVQPPSVTTLVRRLEKAGLVRSVTTPSDRRGVQLRLTAAGRKLVRCVLVGHRQQIRRVLGGLDEPELVVLGGLLQKANGHLSILATQIPDPLT